jgi:aryl-alcohol dehydrogenase-like predicted oxidoreductase
VEFRNLGRSGLRVSAIGLGCNNFGRRIDLEATRKVIHRALDLGITLFDTADIYGGSGGAYPFAGRSGRFDTADIYGASGGSETAMGQVLGDARKRIVLATKFGMQMDTSGEREGGSRRWIMTAVEDSLRRLRTDWIDLYQFHRFDLATPIEETLRALDDLIRQGKVRYIGCSNLPAWRVVEAQWTARQLGLNAFVSCQDQYSLLVRDIERDIIPAASACGMGLLPFFPLASGLLTGKYRRGAPLPADARLAQSSRLAERVLSETNWAKTEQLIEFAEARGHTILELAFSWLLARQPIASVIAGATRPEQVQSNVAAGSWQLTAEDLAEIDRITL